MRCTVAACVALRVVQGPFTIVLMSQRAEHLGDKYTFSHLCISINRKGALQNSSDLDVGRRPELKTDEFCEAPLLLIEI